MNMLQHAGRVITGRTGAHVPHAASKPGIWGGALLRRLVGAVSGLADAVSTGRSVEGELSFGERLLRTGRIRYR